MEDVKSTHFSASLAIRQLLIARKADGKFTEHLNLNMVKSHLNQNMVKSHLNQNMVKSHLNQNKSNGKLADIEYALTSR